MKTEKHIFTYLVELVTVLYMFFRKTFWSAHIRNIQAQQKNCRSQVGSSLGHLNIEFQMVIILRRFVCS